MSLLLLATACSSRFASAAVQLCKPHRRWTAFVASVVPAGIRRWERAYHSCCEFYLLDVTCLKDCSSWPTAALSYNALADASSRDSGAPPRNQLSMALADYDQKSKLNSNACEHVSAAHVAVSMGEVSCLLTEPPATGRDKRIGLVCWIVSRSRQALLGEEDAECLVIPLSLRSKVALRGIPSCERTPAGLPLL